MNLLRSITGSSRRWSASAARWDMRRGETGPGPCRSPPHRLGGSLAESGARSPRRRAKPRRVLRHDRPRALVDRHAVFSPRVRDADLLLPRVPQHMLGIPLERIAPAAGAGQLVAVDIAMPHGQRAL